MHTFKIQFLKLLLLRFQVEHSKTKHYPTLFHSAHQNSPRADSFSRSHEVEECSVIIINIVSGSTSVMQIPLLSVLLKICDLVCVSNSVSFHIENKT